MHRPQGQVREFIKKMERPTSPAAPRMREAELRTRLILEEALETAVGLVGADDALTALIHMVGKVISSHPGQPPDIVEAVDGLCDLIYVAYGTAETIGIDLEPFFNMVHAANMQKENKPIDGHGKRGFKPEGWVDPKVHIKTRLDELAATAWEERYRRD